jgi:hypothetical protein
MGRQGEFSFRERRDSTFSILYDVILAGRGQESLSRGFAPGPGNPAGCRWRRRGDSRGGAGEAAGDGAAGGRDAGGAAEGAADGAGGGGAG